MRCTIVGIIATTEGYVYHATRESKSTKVEGWLTLTFFSKCDHSLGDEVELKCSIRNGEFHYYERKK